MEAIKGPFLPIWFYYPVVSEEMTMLIDIGHHLTAKAIVGPHNCCRHIKMVDPLYHVGFFPFQGDTSVFCSDSYFPATF